jgi:hypothetical protein
VTQVSGIVMWYNGRATRLERVEELSSRSCQNQYDRNGARQLVLTSTRHELSVGIRENIL